ncbi:MAG TPA: Asp-tRNA(Asn)/Glu-tRNA(Gln) amidotransferase subunit GatB [Gemmatimonadaceae bacterium]|nr:Asp-tRNA(Asn)/Glu-tRNA(Gln) amidotransferase subunit GatB [Gemmatimonadaceae bacterium]
MSTERYEMVVGLEVHVQLRTRTKAFCNCSTEYGAPPNTNTCPVCLALPGALPVLNERAVLLAVRAAHALSCEVHPVSVFARKNYFYPDLPKGYQISQYDRPLATGGSLTIGALSDGSPINVGITRLHLEEDAGKSIHDRYPGETAIDLNRAGVPLIEIVSEPDLRSSDEAAAYLHELRQILEYIDVSDVNMEEGSLRVDANISARLRGETRLGTKTEVKNMNSFSAVEQALRAEFDRQCALLHAGEPVEQQTMLWDGTRGEVRPSRTKEGSQDYRYFPEPDLPPLILSREWIESVRESLPELPNAKRARFAEQYALSRADLVVLTSSPRLADYFESVARQLGDPKPAANWVMGEVLAAVRASGWSIADFELRVRPADLVQLLAMVRDGQLSNSAAKRVFAEMAAHGDPPAKIADKLGLRQVSDDGAIAEWVDEVLREHPVEAQRYLDGERKLQGVLVGLVMKKSNGRADPKRVNQLLSARSG